MFAMLTCLAEATPVKFDIPAQPAPAALMLFSRQAAIEVVYSYDDLSKVTANEVRGEFGPDEAIARLLNGTGYTAQRNETGKFVITADAPSRGAIRGRVLSSGSRQPVAGARVGLPGTVLATITADDGRFLLTGIPSGQQTLGIKAAGFATALVAEVAVKNGATSELPELELNPDRDGVERLDEYHVNGGQLLVGGNIYSLGKFVVMPSRFGIAGEHLAKDVTLTSAELEKLPQLGEDIYRTLVRMPGLASDDLSAKFWIRGAPNSQMLSRLDGVDLIEPFHLKDLDSALSIVDLQTIGSLDLVTGGFTIGYGDHLAGVLTMETQAKPGVPRRTTLGLSINNVRATSQGEFAGGQGAWLVAARRGYLDLALKLSRGDTSLSPSYYDLSGKVEYRLSPHQTFSLHALYAGDTLERLHHTNDPDLRSSYDSAYVWGRWQGDFGERLSGEAVLSFSRIDWHRTGSGLFDDYQPFSLRDNRQLNVLGLRDDWTLNLTEHALISSGFEYKSSDASYDYAMSRQLTALRNGELVPFFLTRNAELKPEGDYLAAYTALRLQPFKALIVEPGLRFERHSYTGSFTGNSGGSPRLNASLAFGRTTVRAAWGIYEQGQGLQELSVQDGETTFHAPERAEQRVLGVSHKLMSGLDLRVEAYERLSSHLRPHWENVDDPDNIFPESQYDRIRLNPTDGRARGVEFIAEHRGGRIGWGASYVYSISEELIDSRWVPRNRDQRHAFYVDGTYSPALHWQLSASWQLHTGWPVTDINYFPVTLNNGSRSYSWSYGPINAQRTPLYHRLDLRATRTFQLKRGTLRVFADIFNAYDHANANGYDYSVSLTQNDLTVKKTPRTLFNLIPSAGLSWEF